jgi:hypothetical protein
VATSAQIKLFQPAWLNRDVAVTPSRKAPCRRFATNPRSNELIDNASANRQGAVSASGRPRQGERNKPIEPAAAVEIVSFDVTALAPGVTLLGANVQVASAGRLAAVQARFTALVKAPIWGLTEMV